MMKNEKTYFKPSMFVIIITTRACVIYCILFFGDLRLVL
jgi:hypothetical protein